MRLRILALLVSLVAACGGDPVVPVDATPDANLTDAVDLARPETEITSAPPALTNVATARFEFTSSESSIFRCRLDGGAQATCVSPVMLNSLTNGLHTFEVTAVDTSDNEDLTPASHIWRIDTIPPETAILERPPEIDNSTSVSITFESPGEPAATFECGLDGSLFAVCTSPFTANNLSDGGHDFRVRAKDPAGNFDLSPAPVNWQIDSISPDTVIDTGPAGIVNATGATFTFSSPGAGPGATFACRLDNAPFTACVSPRSFVGLADGAHAFEVRVRDALGNTDPSPARRTWTIDATGPTTSISLRPENPSSDLTPTFEFSASEMATFECQIDGQVPYAPCPSPFTSAALPPGGRFFRVRATDVVGNRGPEATYEWTIDAAGPTVTITSGPNGALASTTATFNWTSNEPALYCYRFTGDPADTCTMALAGSGTVTRPGLAQGAQTFTITATDGLGNAGAPTVRNFSVDTIGPAVMITVGPMNTVGTISNLFTFTSPEVSTYCYKVDTGGELCTSPPGAVTASVTVNANDGAHTLEVVARDALGNRTAMAATRMWTVDTVRPTASIVAGPSQGSTLGVGDATLDLASSEGSTICWKIGAGAETCSAAGALDFQAMLTGLTDGVIVFSVRASDAIGFGPPVTRTWTVDSVRPTVSITAGPATGSTVGSTEATFTVVATEPSRICWVFGANPEVCSAPGVVSISPARSGLGQGANTFSVYARDAIDVGATVSRMWTIDSIRPVVVIAAGPAAGSTSAANMATFMVTASEASTICWRFNGGAESCSAAGVMAADAASAVLPDGGALFEVYGRDTIGTGPTVARSWIIDTARPTITITAGPAGGSTVGSTTASFTLVASERSTICWSFNGAAAICTAAGQLSAVATATGLAQGAASFSVTGADAVGAGAATVRNWTVDTIRPTVSITAGPNQNQLVNSQMATISVSSTEPATICSRVDGAAEQCSAAGAMTHDIMLANLSQGDHSVAIYARDLVGVGTTITRSFVIDTIRPTVTITAGPAQGSTTSSTTANFQVTSSEPATICWKFNAAAETCSAAGSSNAAPSAVGLPPGANTLEVRALDTFGTGLTVTRTWNIDTVRPTVTITAGPAQGSVSPLSQVSFTVTASESSTICWRFNAAAQLTCSMPGQVMVTIASGPLPAGPNVFAVEARDGFGPGPTVLRTWTSDTARPTVSITAGPLAGDLLNSKNATFQLAASEPSTICWQFNGGAQSCSAAGVVTATATAMNLPEGLNTFTATAADAGGPGPTLSRSWTIDSVAPTVTLVNGPAEGASTNAINVTYTINTSEPSVICWRLDGGAQTCSAPNVLTFDAPLINVPVGNRTLTVTATDPATNLRTVVRLFTIDRLAPTVTISAPPAQDAFTNAVAETITISANELVGICWKLDAGADTCSAPGVVSFIANLANLTLGAHALVATVTDAAGNVTLQTRNWTVVAGLQGAPAVTLEPNVGQSLYGTAVASAGDVNGDGFSDVIVGAPNLSNGQEQEGKAYLYLGSATGLGAVAAWTFESDVASAQLGHAVAAAGDINGDGFGDVLIGAPFFSNGQINEGRVYLFLGSNVGGAPLGAAPSWTYESNVADARLGYSLAGAGDVNGDTKLDVVVGAYGYSNGQIAEGAVYLFLGTGAPALPAAASAILDSNLANAQLGGSVAAVGDINGDAKADVVAGAPYYTNGQNQEGAVYVFLGAAAGLAAPAILESNLANAQLGWSVASAGDLNADGKVDVVAGAPYYTNGHPEEGAAYVWLGTAGGLAAVPTIREFNTSGAFFGWSVASAGDTDGDGKADLVVGAPYLNSNVGSAFLYLGTAGGVSANVAWRANGGPGSRFGHSVASAGDVNNDGRKDVVVGAPSFANPDVNEGIARVYHGVAAPMGKAGQPAPVSTPADAVGSSIASFTVSAWVRDAGLAGGDVLSFGTPGSGCTLHGAQAIVALECQAAGTALPIAFGVMGSMARSDGAWHLVTVTVSGDRVALWIDGILTDSAESAGASILGQGEVAVRQVAASGYVVDRLMSTR